MPIRRALISVSDKREVVRFARRLVEQFGVEVLSTGGTARALREAHVPVTEVAVFSNSPEILDGRVKTLHPAIHGGILCRRDHPEDRRLIENGTIRPIDLVAVNLYPFQRTVAKPGVTLDEAVENIDIGGPTMVRAAAKNYAWVAVLTDPDDYDTVLGDLGANQGEVGEELRRRLAVKAFHHTALYDAAIDTYLSKTLVGEVVRHAFTIE